jgi:hypothetical protein
MDASAKPMGAFRSWSQPDDRLPLRPHAIKSAIARAASGTTKLLLYRFTAPRQIIHQAETTVGRTVIFKHHLPAPRAELPPSLDALWIFHRPLGLF